MQKVHTIKASSHSEFFYVVAARYLLFFLNVILSRYSQLWEPQETVSKENPQINKLGHFVVNFFINDSYLLDFFFFSIIIQLR